MDTYSRFLSQYRFWFHMFYAAQNMPFPPCGIHVSQPRDFSLITYTAQLIQKRHLQITRFFHRSAPVHK